MGQAPGPGSAGAVALRGDVAERRRGPGAGAVRPGHRRHAGRRGRRPGHPRGAGATRRHRPGRHVETSLLEALVDFQFEVLTTHLNDGRRLPTRSSFRSAHAYLVRALRRLSGQGRLSRHRHDADRQARRSADLAELAPYRDQPRPGSARATTSRRSSPSRSRPARSTIGLGVLEPADIWCAKVLTWPELLDSEASGARHAADRDSANDDVRSSPPVRRSGSTACARQGRSRRTAHRRA